MRCMTTPEIPGSLMQKTTTTAASSLAPMSATAMPVLIALSTAHLLNDLMQSLVPALYPIIKQSHGLDFGQIGLITSTFQLTASLFQPAVGFYTDRNPQPFSMVCGMAFTLTGLVLLGAAQSYAMLLAGAAIIGLGSAIFHPEATRVARAASGGRPGFAQAVFQLGGQGGTSLGPVLAAMIVVPYGQGSVAWFALVALLAMAVLAYVGRWYAVQVPHLVAMRKNGGSNRSPVATSRGVLLAVFILVVLMFSKSAYQASIMSYYTFFLINKFNVDIASAQIMLFIYLAAGALGVLVGGALGDRIGRRQIIWLSILGPLPFTLMMPYANLFWTGVLSTIVAFVMASALASMLVFAMELLPGRVGLIGGLFYGLAFGLGAVSAALLGALADRIGIEAVFQACAYLPLIGLLTWFLPDIRSGPGRAVR